jgi:type I restriction enzyme, S subunit
MFEESSRCRLGDLISIKHGYAFSSQFYSSEGPYALLTPGNFKEEGGYKSLGEKQKFYANGPVPTEFILEPGAMLVAMTEQAPGLLGATMFTPNDQQYLHNQRLGLITIKNHDHLCEEYLHYLFATPYLRKLISVESTGTKVKHTSPAKLYGIEVILPPVKKQQEISQVLKTWDKAIEKLQRLREAKIKSQNALTNRLAFGSLQLARFREESEPKSYRWFSLPEKWDCAPIGELAAEISERNAEKSQLKVLSCSKHSGFVSSLEYFKKQVFSEDLSGYKKIWKDDFGFPSNHIEEGSIGLQNIADVGLVSPIYTVFRFDPEKVDQSYAFAVLKTELYRHIFNVSTSSSVDRRGSLRWGEFSKIPIPLPPITEQRAIAEVLRTATLEIDTLTSEINAVTRQKRGLMQRLLTGEWRVKPRVGDAMSTTTSDSEDSGGRI